MIKVCFFASLRESVGQSELSVEADSFATLARQLEELLTPAGYTELCAENVRVAVDQTLVDGSWLELVANATALQASCEVAFLPPVTGG